MIGGEFGAVIKENSFIIQEAGGAAVEVEFIGLKLLDPVIRKFADDAPLAGVDGGHVGSGGRDIEPIGGAVPGVMEDVGDEEEGLRWHASAQDTKTAELAGRFDDGDAITLIAKSSRGGIARAATADDDEIVMSAHGSVN